MQFNFLKEVGIRHVVSSKDEHYLYILSELSNEIFVLDLQTYEIVAKESILIEHLKSTSGALFVYLKMESIYMPVPVVRI